ncbi:MAG: tetratricopeptide repeat protein [Candidatus Hydrogenedentes bacterium]|nr:tetratricopeptide repeat protein [Candidatus Hydrogenedentota bacterium]
MVPKLSLRLLTVIVLWNCAATAEAPPLAAGQAKSPAWSLDTRQKEMIVSVSPARQTLQIAGTTGILLGAGISAISNAKHRKAVEEILNGYDAGSIFQEHVETRLQETFGPALERVDPPDPPIRHEDRRAYARDRLRAISHQGHDILLDLEMTYGLFGFEGTLVAKLVGVLRDLAQGEALWEKTLVVSSEDILASDRLTDPTKRMMPNMRSPRLTVEEGAIEQWTSDGGVILKQRMNEAIEGVVAALVTDLGLAQDPKGHYYLGRLVMNRKNFEEAHQLYQEALKLAPDMTAAKNGMSVNLAHNGQLDEAIALAQELTQSAPEYGPAWYNLAWWHAVERNDLAAAGPYYEKALALGMPPEKDIEKKLKAKE